VAALCVRGGGEINYPSNVPVIANRDGCAVDTFNFRLEHFYESHAGLCGGRRVSKRSGFHPWGNLFLFFGVAGRDLGQFCLPAGIDMTLEGAIYVADQLNRRIDVLKYLGGRGCSSENRPAPRTDVKRATGGK
jgi:hypothetical protein